MFAMEPPQTPIMHADETSKIKHNTMMMTQQQERVSYSPAAASSSSSTSIPRKFIPLDPTAERAMLEKQYHDSRLARLLAVRHASNAEAASKRASYQRQRSLKALEDARRCEELLREDSKRLERETEQYRLETQRVRGEAQRASAKLIEEKMKMEEVRKERHRTLEANTQERFQSAMTLVQRKNEARQAERTRMIDTKRRIAETQKENRAILEKKERAFIERTPEHMVACLKVSPSSSSSPSDIHLSASHHHRHSSSIPGGLSPQTPLLSPPTPQIGVWREEEEGPSAPPTPHPHPLSARKPVATPRPTAAAARQMTAPQYRYQKSHPNPYDDAEDKENCIPLETLRQTKQSLAIKLDEVAYDEDMTRLVSESPSREILSPLSPADLKSRALLSYHNSHVSHMAQARLQTRGAGVRPRSQPHPSRSSPAMRERHGHAFELVSKRQGVIERHEIGMDEESKETDVTTTFESASQPSQRTSSSSSSSSKIRRRHNFRKNARSVIPILTPNLAFFQAGPTMKLMENDSEVTSSGRRKAPVAWVISNDPSPSFASSSSPPTHVAAHRGDIDSAVDVSETSKVQVMLGARYYAQSNNAAKATAPSHEMLVQPTLTPHKSVSSLAPSITPRTVEKGIQVEPLNVDESTSPLAYEDESPIPMSLIASPMADENDHLPTLPVIVESHQLSDQAFIAAATHACPTPIQQSILNTNLMTPSSMNSQTMSSKALVTPSSSSSSSSSMKIVTPSSSSLHRPSNETNDSELDRTLNQILQKHLYQEEEEEATITTIQTIVTQHRKVDDDDSSDEEEESNASRIHSTPSIGVGSSSYPSSFTSPSFTSPLGIGVSFDAFTPASVASSSSSSASSLLSTPTAATDLFIETIHYFIEQERLASEKFQKEMTPNKVNTINNEAEKKQTSTFESRFSSEIESTPMMDRSIPQPMVHPSSQLPLPATDYLTLPLAPALPPYADSSFSTPSKLVGGSPSTVSVIPPSTDRKSIYAAFRHMSDDEFQQAQPITTPSAPMTPFRHTPARAAEIDQIDATKRIEFTPNKMRHEQMQQRFEQRMAF